MNKVAKCAIIVVLLILISSSFTFSDTVIMKSGRRIKGLILDEFKDRIVVSTVEGEKTLLVSDIRSAVYSSEEKALMQEARNQEKKRQYIEAYYTYEKVLDLDPDLTEAAERRNYLRSFIEIDTRESIAKKMSLNKTPFTAGEEDPKELVARDLGIVLTSRDKYAQVEKVVSDEALLRIAPGDRIVAVWSLMTAYMDAGEVASMLLVPGEVRLVIERATFPTLGYAKSWFYRMLFSPYKEVIGAAVELYSQGVVVKGLIQSGPFQEAGIEKGDLIYRINGRNTRYMPISRIVETFMENQGRRVEVVVRRNVTLWRKGTE